MYVLFGESPSFIFPNVVNGFVTKATPLEQGDILYFKFYDQDNCDYGDWRSDHTSDPHSSNYQISVSLGNCYQMTNSSGNSDMDTWTLTPALNNNYIKVTTHNGYPAFKVENVPSWDGIEFEYNVTIKRTNAQVNGSDKTGTLDPRFRGGTSA